MIKRVSLILMIWVCASACSDVAQPGRAPSSLDMAQPSLDGQLAIIDMERAPPRPMIDMATITVDMTIDQPDQTLEQSEDASTDAAVDSMIDAEVVTVEECDPRELAAACSAGYFCQPSEESGV